MLGIFYWTFCAWIIDSVMCIRFGKCDVAALWINAYVCECDWTVMNDNIELHFTQQNGQVRQFSIVKLAILFRSLWQQQHNFWQTLLSQRKFFSLPLPLSFSLYVQFNFQMNCVCVVHSALNPRVRPTEWSVFMHAMLVAYSIASLFDLHNAPSLELVENFSHITELKIHWVCDRKNPFYWNWHMVM